MHDKENNISTLIGLGISGTQAKIYLSLIERGTSTIRTISEVSGVGRPDTYRAMLELEHKGLIETVVSTPTKYKPLPLSEVLSILIGRREIESLNLQEKSEKLLKEYENKVIETGNIKDNEFVLVPMGGAFSNRREKLFESSKKSINLMASQKALLRFLVHSFDIIEMVLEKEVSIKITTEKRRNNLLQKIMLRLKNKDCLEIRYMTILPPVSFIIFDDKEILLSTETQTGNKNVAAVWSKNKNLVELAQNYFYNAWFSAIEPPDIEFKRTKVQFDYLFENMINGFAYCKVLVNDENKLTDFVYLQINDAFERIVGLKRNQIIGKRVSQAVPGFEKENPELFRIIDRVCRNGKGEEHEMFFKPLNRWHHMSIYSPKKGYFVELFEDITERKKSELEKQEKYEVLERVAESIGAGLAIINKDYDVSWANSTLMRLGVSPDKKCYQTFNHIEKVCPDCGVRKIFDENIQLDAHEYKNITSEGKANWVELRVTPLKDKDGKVTSALELAVPINERKKAEKELIEQNSAFEAILSSSNSPIFMIDSQYRYIVFNQTHAQVMKALYGVDIRRGQSLLEYISSIEDRNIAKRNIDRALLGEIVEDEKKTGEPNLKRSWFVVRHYPVKDADGRFIGVSVFATDLTEKKQAEEKILDSEETFRLLAEKSSVGVYIIQDGKMAYVNEGFAKSFGYSPEEIIGKLSPNDIIHPDDHQILIANIQEKLNDNIMGGKSVYRGVRKDGSLFYIEVNSSRINYKGKPALMGTQLVIT